MLKIRESSIVRYVLVGVLYAYWVIPPLVLVESYSAWLPAVIGAVVVGYVARKARLWHSLFVSGCVAFAWGRFTIYLVDPSVAFAAPSTVAALVVLGFCGISAIQESEREP